LDYLLDIEDIYMTDLEEWVIKHSSENQLIKRREFFKKSTKKKVINSVLS